MKEKKYTKEEYKRFKAIDDVNYQKIMGARKRAKIKQQILTHQDRFEESLTDKEQKEFRRLKIREMEYWLRRKAKFEEESIVIDIILEWATLLPEDAAKFTTYVDLFYICYGVAKERNIRFMWNTSRAFSRHLSGFDHVLIEKYGAKIERTYGNCSKKPMKKIKFPIKRGEIE